MTVAEDLQEERKVTARPPARVAHCTDFMLKHVNAIWTHFASSPELCFQTSLFHERNVNGFVNNKVTDCNFFALFRQKKKN